jgi:hypothetical protein
MNGYVLSQLSTNIPIEIIKYINEYNKPIPLPYLKEIMEFNIIQYCYILEDRINELEECLWYEPNNESILSEQLGYIEELKELSPPNIDYYFEKKIFNPVMRSIIKFRDYDFDGTHYELIDDKRFYMRWT